MTSRYRIDLAWFEQSQRSFAVVVERRLCPQHQPTPSDDPGRLVESIAGCCQQQPDFLPPRLPLLESVFRLLLARGNQPLSAEEIAEELTTRRGQKVEAELISRLLAAEPRFYGLRAVPEE